MSAGTAPGLDDLLDALDAGRTIPGDSPLHAVMHRMSQEALRLTAELNGAYHPPERVRVAGGGARGGGVAPPAGVYRAVCSQ